MWMQRTAFVLMSVQLVGCVVDTAARQLWPIGRSPISGVSHIVRPSRTDEFSPSPCETVAAFVVKVAEEARVAFNVTGLSVGVVCNHSVVFAGGFGFANKEAGYQSDEHSLYQIASNTKAFTATVALQLEEEKLLDLDAPIRQANPAFRMIDPAGSEILTPRDLLSHRTGLPGHDRITFRSKSRQSLMDAVAYLPMDKPVRYQPGEYNNMMLVAAGVVEEAVSGRTWEDLVTDRILIPLNMTSTFANFSSVIATADRLAVPYRDGKRVERDNVDVSAPCGAIVSSVADFLKWQQLHLRQAARACIAGDATGAHRTHRPFDQFIPVCQQNARNRTEDGEFLLSDSQWTKLLAPNTIFPDLSYFGTYTLGLWWEQYASQFVLHHAGDLEGMASKQAMLPLLGHSIVVLSNENQSPARFVIMLRVLDYLLGLEPPVPSWQDRYLEHLRVEDAENVAADNECRARVESLPMDARKPHWPLQKYANSYAHPAYGNATISISNGTSGTEKAALQVCDCATLWSPGGKEPWLPSCASLFHLGFEKFAVGVRELSELTASTHTIEFGTSPGSNGAVTYFAADLERAVDPIVFKTKSYASKTWPRVLN